MISRLKSRRAGPIGLDIGSHCVKLIQFSADQSRVIDAARWDLPAAGMATAAVRWPQVAAAVRQAREGRHFRGRDVVIGLGSPELFVQNVRVPKVPADEMEKIVRHEAAGRVPFAIDEAEVRFFEAADVRAGEVTKREVILLACQRATLSDAIAAVEEAGLRVAAVDVEPAALLRCYAKQFRRDEDQQQRALLAHLGAASTVVVIARGTDVLFIKYIDVGGRHLDEAVGRHLDMPLSEAAALRRHNGDRRADQQDPEVTRSVAEATRPVVERLASELSLCARYHSVTFRGQPLSRIVISGGEATQTFVDLISARMDLKCELGDPLRSYEFAVQTVRKGQWDVATGLALRDISDN
jgi:type IV pilus assembly protein PilM